MTVRKWDDIEANVKSLFDCKKQIPFIRRPYGGKQIDGTFN